VAPGGCSTREPFGKNGGTVFGKITSATTPSASISARRRSELQLRSASSPTLSSNGFSNDAAQRSKSSWCFDARNGR
jgi:hypothetical protein